MPRAQAISACDSVGVARLTAKECRREQFVYEPLSPTLDPPAPEVGDEEEEAEKPPSPLDECTTRCMSKLKRATPDERRYTEIFVNRERRGRSAWIDGAKKVTAIYSAPSAVSRRKR